MCVLCLKKIRIHGSLQMSYRTPFVNFVPRQSILQGFLHSPPYIYLHGLTLHRNPAYSAKGVHANYPTEVLWETGHRNSF